MERHPSLTAEERNPTKSKKRTKYPDDEFSDGEAVYAKIELNKKARESVKGENRRWLRWRLVVPESRRPHLLAQYECSLTKVVHSERVDL